MDQIRREGNSQMKKDKGLKVLPCLDSPEMAETRKQELDISRSAAAALGQSAVLAADKGFYVTRTGRREDWSQLVQAAVSSKISISPDALLPETLHSLFDETLIQVANETTLGAAHRLTADGKMPLALNFANGIHPGGGFTSGSRAQEEVLCRSSALYKILLDDPMYETHRKRARPDSTDWAILSPNVPVFRADDGTELERPWMLSFITCAAPVAHRIGQPEAGDLLQRRIHRILTIAKAYKYSSLVLGAWGCGAFKNDPLRLASDFRQALEHDFRGVFSDIVFAITDWSTERKYLGPFRDVFSR